MAGEALLDEVVEPSLFADAVCAADLSFGCHITGGTIRGDDLAGEAGVDTCQTELVVEGVVVKSIDALAEVDGVESTTVGG